ncbi:MAG: ATP-dependent helicase [bacterium]|nr:ATP-dependent helicase [bacterium]
MYFREKDFLVSVNRIVLKGNTVRCHASDRSVIMSFIFSESQKNAITCEDDAILVLAGPGSGKTAVITERIRYLIEKKHILPEEILVITFTRAAAQEMKLRFQNLMEGRRLPVWFGTFHAVFFTILKHAYHYRSDQIISSELKYAYMREIIAGYHLCGEEEHELMENLIAEISAVKNNQVELEHYYAKSTGSEQFRDIFQAYERKLRDNRLIDFDDMMVDTKKLLIEREDYRRIWQQKFSHILVDETQDMNQLQYDILRILAGKNERIFMVGDDDQSIYRFRGARPELMRTFLKDYENAKVLYLKENYRCGKRIVDASQNLIRWNETRFDKTVFAGRSVMGIVDVKEYPSSSKENQAMIEQMKKLHADGVDYSKMAVLYRTNRQSGYLLELLGLQGIPFCTRERIPVIYDHWIAKDIFAYLHLGAGSRDRRDILQIMNRPLRYLSRDVLDTPVVDMDEWAAVYEEQPWIASRIEQMEEDFCVMQKMSPYAAMNYIRKGIGYDDYIKSVAGEQGISEEELFAVLEELQQAAGNFNSCYAWEAHTAEYRAQLKQLQKNQQKENGVQIMTMHAAKGLEFDTVFIPQLVEGQLPFKKAILKEDIEEERRLLYVGMTRAKERLYLSGVSTLYNKEATASRFLEQIKNDTTVAGR